MPQSATELQKAADQARQKIESKGVLIKLANKRIRKWQKKVKHERAYFRPTDRAERKVLLWKRRKHDAIYLRAHWGHVLTDALTALASRKPARVKLLETAEKYLGEKEGGAFHQKAVAFVHAALSWPWCSISMAEWIHETFGYTRDELPDDAAYSGCWAAWDRAKRIAIADRLPGHVLVFDWGDGGITDHVATDYTTTSHIGGNQTSNTGGVDCVDIRTHSVSNIVFVLEVRPRA